MRREQRPGRNDSQSSADGNALQQSGPEDYRFEERLPDYLELLRVIRASPAAIRRIGFSPGGRYFGSAFAGTVIILIPLPGW
jgi:hypothetical protein